MIPVPEKILGRRRNSIADMIKRTCNAKSGFYMMARHKDHILSRTGYHMNMPDRNRYPTQASRKDVFNAGLKFYRATGEWLF